MRDAPKPPRLRRVYVITFTAPAREITSGVIQPNLFMEKSDAEERLRQHLDYVDPHRSQEYLRVQYHIRAFKLAGRQP